MSNTESGIHTLNAKCPGLQMGSFQKLANSLNLKLNLLFTVFKFMQDMYKGVQFTPVSLKNVFSDVNICFYGYHVMVAKQTFCVNILIEWCQCHS